MGLTTIPYQVSLVGSQDSTEHHLTLGLEHRLVLMELGHGQDLSLS